ncbi:MAG: SDR family oxidoreductase [Anaerolineae bacterium]|nr:SDR family oxidoreductase [Anaerolineae bacterium]MCB9109472.1 SDR family oxidoreductase [Anaerolineales bacterium]
MDFNRQVVLVTGAGQGIGQAIALAFAEEGSGVIVNDINPTTAAETAAQINDTGGRAIAIPADIAERHAVKAMLAQAQEQFGPVSTLVNNAGYADFMPFMEYAPERWQRLLDIDLTGVYHCTQAAVPYMAANGAGFVVNITSVHASQTLPNMAAYAAAKAGVVALTKSLAQELGPKNIRVNCLSPGTIETDGLDAYFNSLPEDKRESQRAYMRSWCSMGRFGRPRDIANVVLFLCSDKAAFVHGTEIVVDGGHLARLF